MFEAPSSDETLRQRIRREVEISGSPALHRRLAELDARAARRIHPNDTFRITRALEVLESTGRPISAHHSSHGFGRPRFNVLSLGLTLPRDQLYARINRRVDQMIEQGLLEEVRALLDSGYAPELKPMQSLGYRHMVAFLLGALSWDETVRTLKRDHRRYAKRQMTWFGRIPAIHWLAPDDIDSAQRLVADFMSRTIENSKVDDHH